MQLGYAMKVCKGESMQLVTRVTIALPRDLWEKVKRTVPSGKRSGLISQALENELRRRSRLEQTVQLRQFQAGMLKKYGEFPASADEITQARQEHDDELDRGG
jgi:metal-responsive CopG/Arc/MetJ family transcriptional regulator